MEKGGRTKRISEEFHGLKNLGHQVKLVTFEEPPDWVRNHYLHSEDWVVLPKGSSRIDFGLLRSLYALVGDFKPDIIDAHCEGSAFYAGLVSRFSSAKCVATVHRSNLQYYSADWKMKLYYRFSDSFVAVSEQRRGLMSTALGIPDSRMKVLHWGIDTTSLEVNLDRDAARQRLGISAGAVLLSVGHLGVIKGHDDSIVALAKLKEHRHDVKLYIAGDGAAADYARLQGSVDALGVQDAVTLLGQTANVPEWLVACDIFLQPSHEEAFGLVFLEAGFCAKPTVATRVGGIPEIVVDEVTGLLVDPQAPDQIAAAIEQLLTNPVEAERLGAAAKQRVTKEFSLEAKVAGLVEHFRSLLPTA